jgi:hypothetical protein
MTTLATEYRDTDIDPSSPKADYVRALVKGNKDHFKAFKANCARADMYFEAENDIPVPEELPITSVHMGSARTIITTAVDHINTENMSVEVRASGRAQARAERIQMSLQGIWLQIKDPVLTTALYQEALYGITWIKPQFEPDLWPDSPQWDDKKYQGNDGVFREDMRRYMEMRKIAFPLSCEVINPQNMIWDDSASGPKWAIEIYEGVKVGKLRKFFPAWFAQAATKNSDTEEYAVYWDAEWFGVLIGGEWATRPYRHGYGIMPLIPAIMANTINSKMAPLEKRYQGLLSGVYDLLDAEDRIATAMEAILQGYAWPSIDFSGDNNTVLKAVAAAYRIIGAKNILQKGTRAVPAPRPAVQQELFTVLGQFQAQIEQNTVAAVARGQSPSGISSGFGVTSLAGMARLRFGPMADGLSRAVEQCNGVFLRVIELKIGRAITVSARSEVHNFDQRIGPEDIRGLYENDVKFKAESPDERERAASLGERLYGAGLISLTEAQRRAGIVNPQQEQIQMIAERIAAVAEEASIEAVAAELSEDNQPAPSVAAAADIDLSGQRAQTANNTGQFTPGLQQSQSVQNPASQEKRIRTRRLMEQAFPQGLSDMTNLGRRASTANSNGTALPSGGRSINFGG